MALGWKGNRIMYYAHTCIGRERSVRTCVEVSAHGTFFSLANCFALSLYFGSRPPARMPGNCSIFGSRGVEALGKGEWGARRGVGGGGGRGDVNTECTVVVLRTVDSHRGIE